MKNSTKRQSCFGREKLAIVLALLLFAFVILAGCLNETETDSETAADTSDTSRISAAASDTYDESEPVDSETNIDSDTETDMETETEAETEESSTSAAHEHVYGDATCTSPSICAECGETRGEALGHDWRPADCTSPQSCKRCGETTGERADHSYVDGKCAECGQIDPEYKSQPDEIMVWIPTKGGKKYHSKKSCSNMEDPEYVPLSEAVALGFEACKRCH